MRKLPNIRLQAAVVPRLALAAMWLFLLSPILFEPLRVRGVADGFYGFHLVSYSFNLVASILWIGLLHFAVKRPLLLHLALAPFYISTAADLFLIFVFGERLSSAFAYVALTNLSEAGDFFATYWRPVMIVAAVLACMYCSGLLVIWRLRLRRSPKASFTCAILLLGTYLIALVHSGLSLTRLPSAATIEPPLLAVQYKEMSAPVGDAFQIGLAMQIVANERKIMRQRVENSLAARLSRRDDNEVYVWIIGESSRPQDWSLFGYPRDTTPRLRTMPNVIALPNMLTTAPQTSIAVPSMLSLQPITDWDAVLAQRSIVSAFNEVGFKTYWLSTQEVDGFSGIVPAVAAEAGYTRFFDRALDGALLAEFRRLLDAAAPGQKLLFILHTRGSHFEYAKRYPPEFSRFKTPDGTRREQLVDAYDNSVLYTDWLISKVIATLARRTGPSALIYASDHGENLLDDDAQLLGHLIGNRYDLPTAALIWLSEPLRARFPEMAEMAVAHADAKLSLSNLSQSLLDLAGINALGADRSMSIFEPGFVPKERWYIARGKLRKEENMIATR